MAELRPAPAKRVNAGQKSLAKPRAKLLTVTQAARLLRMPRRTLCDWCEIGQIACTQTVGGAHRRHYRIERSVVEQLLGAKIDDVIESAA